MNHCYNIKIAILSMYMDLNQTIQEYATQPSLTHQFVLSLLKNYKKLNDKINELLKKYCIQTFGVRL
ncbi:MAG: hypothetical protein JWN56_1340 [Sphingobacteriales bacterium]|nr:hypothetical protein [Sphingobacteriales bacterium]